MLESNHFSFTPLPLSIFVTWEIKAKNPRSTIKQGISADNTFATPSRLLFNKENQNV
ncbi:hypothetical protein IKE72_01405 [Candidatus Saccharibacteria bacterium]|nr:hypothetical protein [Candidatus Saccharibacteria bacterium]